MDLHKVLYDHFAGMLSGEGLSATTIESEVNSLTHKLEASLKDTQNELAMLRLILDTLPLGVFWKDTESVFLGCNTAFQKMSSMVGPIVGVTDYELKEGDEAKQFTNEDLDVIKSKKLKVYTSPPNEHKNRWTKTIKVPLVLDGDVIGLVGISEDITRRKQARAQLALSENKLRLLSETIPDIIWMMDTTLKLTYLNPAVTTFTVYTVEEALAMPIEERYSPETLKVMRKKFQIAMVDPAYTEDTMEAEVYKKDGSSLWMMVHIRTIKDENGTLQGIVGVSRDITFQKKKEALLTEFATLDSLTGVINRRFFMDRLSDELDRSVRYSLSASVMMLDIDHFKKVNDTYGHAAGDAALLRFVNVVQECLRSSDFLGRIGGEEFAIVLPGTTLSGATILADRILRTVAAAEIHYGGKVFKVTTSIGVTESLPPDTPSSVVDRADQALYTAKDSGRNCFRVV